MAVLGLHCCMGFFSSVVGQRPHSLVVVLRLLIAMGSLDAEYRLQGEWNSVAVACGSNNCSSQVLEHRLNSCGTWA